MFYKFNIPNHSIKVNTNIFISISYTKLSTEPSIEHSHQYYEILFPENDFGLLLCNHKEIPINRNKLYIIPPNVSHTEKNLNKYNESRYFSLKTPIQLISNDDGVSAPLIVDITNNFQEMNSYLSYTLKFSNNGDTDLALLNLACFQSIFTNTCVLPSNMAIKKSQPIQNFMWEIKSYLTNNFDKNINLETLSRQYLLSHSALTTNFKATYGLTPKEYLIRVRLQKAADLLNASNYQISTIANFCGFLSPAHFAMSFKQFYGTSPKEYRKKAQQSSSSPYIKPLIQ